MKKLHISALICCLSCVLLLSSCLTTTYVAQYQVTMPVYSRQVSIIIDQNEFENKSGVNFFVGELGEWLGRHQIDVKLNRDVGNTGVYIIPSFYGQKYLRRDGCWIYIYKNVYLDIYSHDQQKLKSLYLGEIRSGTSYGNLQAVFARSITLSAP